ncbi:MAG TPA: hypothetical protein VKZ92_00135 [Pseudohongiella sp.]|nr:hypothetical protein [Pseudohongiella sp.]
MDKGLLTNLVASVVVVLGYLVPGAGGQWLLSAGLFALSGSLTNSIAIHMLFEKVPGLYGSGVIVSRFDDFKRGIREMIIQQFFSNDAIDRFFDASSMISNGFNKLLPEMVEEIDLDRAFDSLVEAIMQSSLGGMLGFVGGPKALNGLRDPFNERMRGFFYELVQSEEFQARFAERVENMTHSDAVISKLEELVDRRLDELTPEQVKLLVQKMIREHLGWLVVWGGVIGGLMGLLYQALSSI